ncbi:4'-phosphopantetheinyl transferase superfamily protein [Halomonas sp. NO4]|uniref:4'-phosphopantetheinyl transferase superfamily protein n=1 Tax=Halomonas sp. NO4 TaxID=2484813 RepID=UPI001F08EB44|nr:4'-phosphopantetheinyl transferase superfamily protein [Halomonas sp. NO4]
MTPCLDLLLAQVPAGSSGACLSRLGRELLARLTARQGFHCPVNGWSPRGGGVPSHPSLPGTWYACLSHRDRRVIAGLANVPVGIDLEHSQPRHAARLAALVDLLPEASTRHAILADANPQQVFYRAWTLHEALFKLDCLSGNPPSTVLGTRLSRLKPAGSTQAWQWQHRGWTLSICAHHQGLRIRSLPAIPLTKGMALR